MATTTRNRRNTSATPPAAPSGPELPPQLADWQVVVFHERRPAEYKLIAPDGLWETRTYVHREKAVAEAQQRVLSQPRAEVVEQDPLEATITILGTHGIECRQNGSHYDLVVVQQNLSITALSTAQMGMVAEVLRRAEALGLTVEFGGQWGGKCWLELRRGGTPLSIADVTLEDALIMLSDEERATAQQAQQVEPTPTPTWGNLLGVTHRWQRIPGDGWEAACGMTMQADEEPDGDDGDDGTPRCRQCDPDTQEVGYQVAAPAPKQDLASLLAEHAKTLPEQPDLATMFARPAGVPERLDVPIDLVVPGRAQPREFFDEAALERLAVSIREHGVLTPVKVFASKLCKFELVAGERRWRAAQRVGLTVIPIEVVELTWAQILEIAIIDNIERQQLTPVEEGRAFERLLVEFGYSENKLAKRLGVPRATIQQRRALAQAVPEVAQALTTEEITFSIARAIAQGAAGIPEAQIEALRRCREHQQSTWQGKLNEERAKAYTTEAILDTAKKTLAPLGWCVGTCTFAGSKQATVVFTDGCRPRVVGAAEIAAILAAGERPTGEPVEAATLTKEQQQAMKRRSRSLTYCGPWTIDTNSKSTKPRIFSPAELLDLAEATVAEVAALSTRAAAAGWTLTWDDRDYSVTVAREGKRETAYGWNAAAALVNRIEATGGQEAARREPENQCVQCRETTRDCKYTRYKCPDNHFRYCYVCASCQAKLDAAKETRIAELRTGMGDELGRWLDQAPATLLKLMLISVQGDRDLHRTTAQICALPEQELRTAAAQHLVEKAFELEYEGVGSFRQSDPGLEALAQRLQAVENTLDLNEGAEEDDTWAGVLQAALVELDTIVETLAGAAGDLAEELRTRAGEARVQLVELLGEVQAAEQPATEEQPAADGAGLNVIAQGLNAIAQRLAEARTWCDETEAANLIDIKNWEDAVADLVAQLREINPMTLGEPGQPVREWRNTLLRDAQRLADELKGWRETAKKALTGA